MTADPVTVLIRPEPVTVVTSIEPETIVQAEPLAGASVVIRPEPATIITYLEPVNTVVVQSGAFGLTGGGDATYTFTQLAPSAEWRIPHPLKKHPSVTVQDSADNVVVGEVQYLGDDLVVVRFLAPFSGRADLN